MEIHNTAFAFKTNNEINDMTFYSHRIINRSIIGLDSTHFGIWMDPDLGCYTDDYIGCDVDRNLAYAYNSDDLDGNSTCDDCMVPTYCMDIPVVGIDFLKGPMDEFGKELRMSSFTYYDSGIASPVSATLAPQEAEDYYNYLSGSWRDGTPMTYGGNAYNPSSTETVKHAYTSPPNDPNGWSMCNSGYDGGDFRLIQGAGPFFLFPGAVNEIVTGVIWVPSIEHPCPDLSAFFDADDKAEEFFGNCFRDLSTKLFEPAILDPITIFPNPYSLSTGGLLNMKNLPSTAQVSIFDINGRLVKTYTGESKLQLDLSGNLDQPSPGTYVIQVQAEAYEAQAYKLLIMD